MLIRFDSRAEVNLRYEILSPFSLFRSRRLSPLNAGLARVDAVARSRAKGRGRARGCLPRK